MDKPKTGKIIIALENGAGLEVRGIPAEACRYIGRLHGEVNRLLELTKSKDAEIERMRSDIYVAVSIMQGMRSILGDYMTNRNIDKSVRQSMKAFLRLYEKGKSDHAHEQALKASRAAIEGGGQ